MYWRKGGVAQKTLQTRRQSGTVLSLVSLIFLIKLPTFNPPPFLQPRPLWSHFSLAMQDYFKAVGTTQSPFSSCFFFSSGSKLCGREEKKKQKTKMMSEWKLASWLCFTCITSAEWEHAPLLNPASTRSFYKRLSPYSVHPKTVERYCEHSTGTKTETEIGEEHKCINNGWTGAVMNHRYMCHSHIKRHSKVTFKARDGKKKTKKKNKRGLASCLQRLFTTRNGNSRRKSKNVRAAKRHFLLTL